MVLPEFGLPTSAMVEGWTGATTNPAASGALPDKAGEESTEVRELEDTGYVLRLIAPASVWRSDNR